MYCPLWSEEGLGWEAETLGFCPGTTLSLSVIGRVSLVLHPWFGKPPAFYPSLEDAQVC